MNEHRPQVRISHRSLALAPTIASLFYYLLYYVLHTCIFVNDVKQLSRTPLFIPTIKMNHHIGGVYTDPFHSPVTASANLYGLPSPWYGGIRILAPNNNSNKIDGIVCIGCDDGIHWWTLTGTILPPEQQDDGSNITKLSMDFTPKAPGVGLLRCGFDHVKGALHFYDDDNEEVIGNTWSRLTTTSSFSSSSSSSLPLLELQTKHSAFNDCNGLYVDPTLTKPGSFAGWRVVSDRVGKYISDEDVSVIGTEDGVTWWSRTGGSMVSRRQGQIAIGGGGDSAVAAKIQAGTLQLTEWNEEDETTKWVKMIPRLDLHSLPTTSSTS